MANTAMSKADSTRYLRRLSTRGGDTVKHGQEFVASILHSSWTDYLMGLVIVLNIFVMIIEIDRSARMLDSEVAAGEPVHWTEVFGYAVLLIFVIELLLRLFAFRCTFFKDGWNVFDFVIVSTDAVMFFISLLGEDLFPVSILRIFRLSKLARVSKVLRVFPELRMLLASLTSSLTTIFWGSCMLALVLLVWAMVAVLLIHPLNKDVDYDGCERCPRAYGSVMAAALTFWQQIVAGDSWGMATIPLIEKHPGTAVFFVPLLLSVGLAVMNLILGVVVSVAQQKKDDLEEAENMETNMITLEKETRLLALCKQMDADHSGELSQSELYAGFDTPGEFRDSMSALGITKDDFDVVWAMLDIQKTGSVPYKRLVSRLYRMRHSTSEFTLAFLKYHITVVRDMLLEQMDASTLKQKLEEELSKIEDKEDMLLERQEQLLEKFHVAPCEAHKTEHKVDLGSHDVDLSILKGKEKLQKIEVNLKSYELFCKQLMEHCGFDDQAAREEWNRRKLLPERYQQRIDSRGCMILELDIEAFKKQLAQEQAPSLQKLQESQEKEHKSKVKKDAQAQALLSKSHDRSNPFNMDGSFDEMPTDLGDDTEIWLRRVCREISMLRVDMKDMMVEVDRKFISRELPLPIAQQSITSPQKPSLDLLVVPDKTSGAACALLPRCWDRA